MRVRKNRNFAAIYSTFPPFRDASVRIRVLQGSAHPQTAIDRIATQFARSLFACALHASHSTSLMYSRAHNLQGMRTWIDLALVTASNPYLESEIPRPDSLTPVQGRDGSR